MLVIEGVAAVIRVIPVLAIKGVAAIKTIHSGKYYICIVALNSVV